jgi:hypothetical protein
MGLSIIGTSGLQRGLEAAETGINSDTFTCRYYPQFKDFINNYQGQETAFAVPDKYNRDVSFSGEVSGSTGLGGAVYLTTAYTFANDSSDYVAVSSGSNAGGFYLNEITVSQSRDGWRRVDGTAKSSPLIS